MVDIEQVLFAAQQIESVVLNDRQHALILFGKGAQNRQPADVMEQTGGVPGFLLYSQTVRQPFADLGGRLSVFSSRLAGVFGFWACWGNLRPDWSRLDRPILQAPTSHP